MMPRNSTKAVVIGGDPAPPQPLPADPILLHDLSETIGSALAAAQRQLDRFSTGGTRFVIDDADITLPIRVSVDDLRQIGIAAGAGEGQIRVRFHASQPVPPPPDYVFTPLSKLGLLKDEQLQILASRQVFTVDDYLRVSRNAPGQAALKRLQVDVPRESVFGRSVLLTLDGMSPEIARVLFSLAIDTVETFLSQKPEDIAARLTKAGVGVGLETLRAWQNDLRRWYQS